MKIGVTGSRELTRPQEKQAKMILRGLLSNYGPGDELHHGAARGIDKIAAAIAEHYGLEVVPHYPKTQRWETGYKPRNVEIVKSVEYLIAIHSPSSATGGTIWTFNYAERRNVRADWIELTAE